MAEAAQVQFSSLFSAEEVLCRTTARDRDAMVRELVRLAARRAGTPEIEAAVAAILARDDDPPSLAAKGIAILHARLPGINRMGVAVATSEPGIPFGPGAEGLANLVILMLVPLDRPGLCLQARSSLAPLLRDPAAVGQALALAAPAEVWQFFDRRGLVFPPYVCAGDIVNTQFIALRDSDTLERAIDLFVLHHIAELPVVDKDGDLVGVVTEDELLHVCLPDYILWMEDLSPVIDFQPFAQVLKNQGTTWLQDIMTQKYAAVPEDAPAIQVAKEMTRHNLRQVLVVRGEKLLGIITIHDFVNKVLRA
jgi:CBS domain-containing protein